MSSAGPPLLIAAAGVGFGHAILPDHWLPLAVLGRTRRYPLSRIARLSCLAGVAHVLVSLVLGAVIVVVGLQFRSVVQSAQDAIIGSVLIATGLGFGALELSGRGHGGHDHDHQHGHGHDHAEGLGVRQDHHGQDHHGQDHHGQDHHGQDHHDHEERLGDRPGHHRGMRGLAAVMVPFGAAASPDLTILPVFLAATAAGVVTAIGSLVVFAAVTIGTIVGLTLAAAGGGYELRGQWLERWGTVLTATVLVLIGALVITGTI